ncbi:ketimine reductase mu-crystallin-like [Corticium candelabrum]|uniref:ketimine reductase mu-crystallin-like n=1 Tax=Corticium candelabrum TaxID=121492 RepID=UPI002E321607|nr:ketimine reductase mu-crystallin-like [Corticium candelabrum]
MSSHGKDAAPLYIDSATVAELLKPDELMSVVETSLIDFSRRDGSVVQPVRTTVPVEEHKGLLYMMPGYSRNASSLATKFVAFFQDNADKGLPSHMAKIVLFDPSTGRVLALMDGGVMTELRTAAASAVATKYLSSKNAAVLAILGSGAQAHSHVKLLKLVRDFKEIRVWSPTLSHMQAFAQEVGAVACGSAEEAVHDADVIVTVTSAAEPVLFGKWVKPGAHINAVGACRSTWRELDDEVMLTSTVVVDSREGAVKESGDIILSKATIACELGEVASGAVTVDATRTTLFKSLGMAVEDVVSSKLVYDRFMAQQKAGDL